MALWQSPAPDCDSQGAVPTPRNKGGDGVTWSPRTGLAEGSTAAELGVEPQGPGQAPGAAELPPPGLGQRSLLLRAVAAPSSMACVLPGQGRQGFGLDKVAMCHLQDSCPHPCVPRPGVLSRLPRAAVRLSPHSREQLLVLISFLQTFSASGTCWK